MLSKCFSLKSRFSPRIARELFLLYNGVPLKLLDTLCSCHGGQRPIGGCAHAIAVLRLLSQLTNRVEPVQPTRSELMLKRASWHFRGSDSEGRGVQVVAVGLTPTRSHRLPVQRCSLSICGFTAFLMCLRPTVSCVLYLVLSKL